MNKYIGSKNAYLEQKYVISGDGIIETDNWGGKTDWIKNSKPELIRGVGGLFGYNYASCVEDGNGASYNSRWSCCSGVWSRALENFDS